MRCVDLASFYGQDSHSLGLRLRDDNSSFHAMSAGDLLDLTLANADLKRGKVSDSAGIEYYLDDTAGFGHLNFGIVQDLLRGPGANPSVESQEMRDRLLEAAILQDYPHTPRALYALGVH
jgi:hypothetical protein